MFFHVYSQFFQCFPNDRPGSVRVYDFPTSRLVFAFSMLSQCSTWKRTFLRFSHIPVYLWACPSPSLLLLEVYIFTSLPPTFLHTPGTFQLYFFFQKSNTTPENSNPDESCGDTMRVRKLRSRLTTSETHGARPKRNSDQFRDFTPSATTAAAPARTDATRIRVVPHIQLSKSE